MTLRRPDPAALPPAKHARGFTLIELLVAITLMAVVSLMAWRGLDAITSLRDNLEARAVETEGLLRLLGQLERDVVQRAPNMVLEAALAPAMPGASPGTAGTAGVPGQAGGTTPAAGPRSLPLALETLAPQRGGQGSELNIIRAGPYAPGTWQRVRWWQEGTRLLRAAGEPSATYPLPEPGPNDVAVVMTAVRNFALSGWVHPTGWVPLPRPADANTPVDGLQILITRNGGDQDEHYRRIISFQ